MIKQFLCDISEITDLNDSLKIKTVRRMVKFEQSAWLEPYVAMNTELLKNVRNNP